jgi:hypothetical protein
MLRMATKTVQIAARLPADIVGAIDRAAAEDDRTRTDQLTHLARIGLAGRARLKELERIAAETIAAANGAANTGAADHLAEHRRLIGFKEETV